MCSVSDTATRPGPGSVDGTLLYDYPTGEVALLLDRLQQRVYLGSGLHGYLVDVVSDVPLTLLGQVGAERLLSLPLEADVDLCSLNRGDHRDVDEGGIADISLPAGGDRSRCPPLREVDLDGPLPRPGSVDGTLLYLSTNF